jgi:hypothetical protein
MLAHGFTAELLDDLVRDGLATAASGIMYAGKRPITVTRLRITDIGRQALAGTQRAAGGGPSIVATRVRAAPLGMFSAIPIGPFQSALAVFAKLMAIRRQFLENPL